MTTKFRYKRSVREKQIRIYGAGQVTEKTTRKAVDRIDFEFSRRSYTSIIRKINEIAVPVLSVIEILRFLADILSVL